VKVPDEGEGWTLVLDRMASPATFSCLSTEKALVIPIGVLERYDCTLCIQRIVNTFVFASRSELFNVDTSGRRKGFSTSTANLRIIRLREKTSLGNDWSRTAAECQSIILNWYLNDCTVLRQLVV
jgi:hypothetical protein